MDIEQILEDVRLTLAAQILESNAIIKWEVAHSKIVFVRRKLRSVLYNLINNSIKYKSAGRVPEILIETYIEGDYFVLSVSDNGRGIAENNLEKIFKKYERIANDVEGTGVGLHLVKEIVNLSGGKIEVESELDKGTVFRIYLKNQNPNISDDADISSNKA